MKREKREGFSSHVDHQNIGRIDHRTDNNIVNITSNPILDLFEAIETEDLDKVQFYVKNNSSIINQVHKFQPVQGRLIVASPLHYAIERNNKPIVMALLKSKNIRPSAKESMP
ncbi:hypothetical protein [Cardinium endosymbiont of Tipula unca]|uniref:hypothetical protein n=1 Tax=Cardinium endosymbiont of Tipula unca TaxID=3066216 RepID=UPI0030CD38EE